jgi:hypothetical protein
MHRRVHRPIRGSIVDVVFLYYSEPRVMVAYGGTKTTKTGPLVGYVWWNEEGENNMYKKLE